MAVFAGKNREKVNVITAMQDNTDNNQGLRNVVKLCLKHRGIPMV